MDTSPDQDSKGGFSTYLEDFFSAIKIFGYLDRSIFHELTRQMQTYKLEKGEIIKLDNQKGFSVLVDGTIEVFAKTDDSDVRRRYDKDQMCLNGENYQLVNEVHKGAPVSSLFTILALFTGALTESRERSRPGSGNMSSAESLDKFNLSEPQINLAEENSDANAGPNLNDFSDQSSNSTNANAKFRLQLNDIVARAAEDSTIAIIPQSTFHRLVLKYPKATNHIIQVVLTRLSRVTFQSCHQYLGLTPEIFETEIELNNRASYKLPQYLRDRAVNGIREFIKKSPSSSNEPFIYLGKNEKSFKHKLPNQSVVNGPRSRQVSLQPNSSHPGDLLSNVPLYRTETVNNYGTPGRPTTFNKLPFSADEETEDSALRFAITECIFKILRLDRPILKPDQPPSMIGSPVIGPVSEDSNRRSQRPSFSNVIKGLVPIEENYSFNDDDSFSSSVQSYDSAQVEASQNIEVMYYKKGSILMEQQGEAHGLFYVIDGLLEVEYHDKYGNNSSLYTVKPGGIAGFIASVLSSKSFVTVKAQTDVYVGFLSQSVVERIAERYPMFLLGMANTLTGILPSLIVMLDFALDWVQVPGSHVLFNEGDDADAIYIVLNGRLRSVTKDANNNIKIHGEYGQGESIGELEVLTVSKRPYTLHAIRETQLAKFPRSLFESLAKRHPSTTIEVSRIVASRVLNRLGAPSLQGYEIPPSSNFRTVAVIPITAGLPVSEFGLKLQSAYNDISHNVFLLNISTVLRRLGRNAFNKIGILKLSGYLADLEERYQTVLYIADSSVTSPWTKTCMTQADCILLLADASTQPNMGEFERLLVTKKTTAKTELILLHRDRYVPDGLTAKWLKNRIWVNTHHHVQMDFTTRVNEPEPLNSQEGGPLSKFRSKVKLIQSELITKYKQRGRPVYSNSYVHKNDFARLARILSGQAVGLVLGGGGARGISHIGVIRALEENGIPIDYVGGTSIGSFVGGLYAKEYDIVPIYGRAKKFASRISSLWRMAFDLTYPATSYTTGHEFNRGIWKAFGETQIEDFWLRYFNNTTNITHSRMEIHESGYAWRYIRASMSLAGLLPPLTDKGSMLLDGGYVDNLPVEQMKSWGAKYIFAVDVGSVDDTTPMTYGDSLSGLWVIFNRWNIFSRHPNVPNLAEIQQRLAYVSSVGALEKAKATSGVFYLRPPIDNYATLDFGKFDEIYRVGTIYGHQFLDNLKQENKFPKIPGAGVVKGRPRKQLTRRNSI